MKKYFVYGYVCLLIFAGSCQFIRNVTFPDIGLLTYEVKGFSIALIAGFFMIAMLFRMNKSFFYLAYFGAIAGQVYTFIALYSQKIISSGFTFSLGFYLYVVAFILLIISLFFKFEEKKALAYDDKTLINNFANNIADNNNNIADSYVFGTYIFGIDGYESLVDKACCLCRDDKNKVLILYTANNNGVSKMEFKFDDIVEIKSKKRVILNESLEKKQDHTVENQLLASAIVAAPFGALIGSSKIFNDANVISKVNYKEVYELSIEYKIPEKTKILMIYCMENPEMFSNKFKNLQNM